MELLEFICEQSVTVRKIIAIHFVKSIHSLRLRQKTLLKIWALDFKRHLDRGLFLLIGRFFCGTVFA